MPGEGNYFKIEKPYNLLAFENISNSFSVFSAQMLDYLSEFGIKSFTVYLFLLSICMLIYLFFKTRKNPNSLLLNYYTVFAIVFSIAVLSAPIVNGNYTGYDTLRYNVYPFYLISLNIPLFLAYTVKKSKLLAIGKQCLNVCCMILLATGIFFTNKEELKKYFTFYPETARVLDELAETQGLLCGVGNYWEAKKVTLFSKKKVRVLAVYDDLAFTEHADNTTWFSTNRFNFILTANFVDTITYKSRVLWLKSIENTANLQILKTNVFTYQKDKSTLPINNSGSE